MDVDMLTSSPQEIAAIACDEETRPAVLTAWAGVIQSINYPSPPDDAIYCEYVIDPYNTTENTGLALYVNDFETEPDFDFATIYDGAPIPDNLVATLTGIVNTGTDYYFGDSPRVTITYENDCLTSYDPGFEFFYYTMDGNEGAQNLTADACDGDGAIVILDEIQNKVYLESPNFPSNYQDDEYCQWIIKSACHDGSYRNLSISALEFYTAETNDHVFIRRDRGPVSVVIDTLYGFIDPLSYTLDVGYGTMTVDFVTDSGSVAKGFRMVVYFTD